MPNNSNDNNDTDQNNVDIHTCSPRQLRKLIRQQKHTGPTSGLCAGYLQANVVIIHKDLAPDFERFCRANSQACPILEVMSPGQTRPKVLVSLRENLKKEQNTEEESSLDEEEAEEQEEEDIRTDLPQYRIWSRDQMVRDVKDIREYWSNDMVTFFFGCSFSFERALMNGGIPIRNIEQNRNVSMYVTNRQCEPYGIFRGPLVVSMRPVKNELVQKAIDITAQFGDTHGAPVHCGAPTVLGISDLSKVDFGDAVDVDLETETPCFWACGVTSTLAAISSNSDLIITHVPGHMMVSDVKEPIVKY